MQSVYTPNQVLGRTLAIGCTAVEITQRCNLDCTLCYLSERSEEVRDIPLEEVFNRLDRIRDEFGPDTSVQITGGDPTLRKHDELIEIVRYARRIGLFPALFTNGIAASRKLLIELAHVGLCDVAFHVDTTQRRAGFDSEVQLNVVRKDYLDRATDLGLNVIFNTTIHEGNVDEIPALIYFFCGACAANRIGFVSITGGDRTRRVGRTHRIHIPRIDTTENRAGDGVPARLGRHPGWPSVLSHLCADDTDQRSLLSRNNGHGSVFTIY